ncbi:hypothetical protein [Streptomyces sp. NPDC047070]|uniref:hypothetical protein n=1 Tax=Streptomyces sp. NPDC047070 TaxID=3154923 RepID=UPI003454B418
MNQNPSPELAPALALVNLLAASPELHSIIWTVGETPGILSGRHTGESGTGELVDAVAAVTGGTVARSSLSRGDDRHGTAQLVTTYHGASLHVWASYPLPGIDGLTSTDLRDLMASCPLGALVCLPGGAQ